MGLYQVPDNNAGLNPLTNNSTFAGIWGNETILRTTRPAGRIVGERNEQMPRNEMRELINSVGIEMEFMSVNRSSLNFRDDLQKELANYRIDHDASCESPIETFLNYPIVFKDEVSKKELSPYLGSIVVGGEIISPVSNSLSPQWVHEIEHLCKVLYEHGEREDTVRDAFHVHVNITRDVPLHTIKNLLQFTGAYEAILYRLGGMGRINRGVENDYIYERPFLGNGPPVVNDGKIKFPIVDYNDLMGATTKQEFFERYGDAGHYSNRGVRYVTCRYMSVNFYPILTQGSIEFRTANKTLNPRYIIAWTNFCKAIVGTSFYNRDLQLNTLRPLAENREIGVNEFVDSLRPLDLDNSTIDVLVEIWEESPTPEFDNVWRYSHLPDQTRFVGNYRPKAITEMVKKSRHVDLHVLNAAPAEIGNNNSIPFVQADRPVTRIRRNGLLNNNQSNLFRQNQTDVANRIGPALADRINNHPQMLFVEIPNEFSVMNASYPGFFFSFTKYQNDGFIDVFVTHLESDVSDEIEVMYGDEQDIFSLESVANTYYARMEEMVERGDI